MNDVYEITINYGCSLVEMINQRKYYRVSSGITKEHFPVNGNGMVNVKVKLFHFLGYVLTKDVIVEMERAGYRPARIEELLALDQKFPKIQTRCIVIALGSQWQGFVPGCGLAGLCSKNGVSCDLPVLNLNCFPGNYSSDHCFAAVRK